MQLKCDEPLSDFDYNFNMRRYTPVLERLDPTSRTLFGQVGKACRTAVLGSGLPRLPTGVTARVRVRVQVVEDICMSVERLAWAKANGYQWTEVNGRAVVRFAAKGGRLDLLRWGWKHRCLSMETIYSAAAEGGQLETLRWAREQRPLFDTTACTAAAAGGNLKMLRLLREHGCPWCKQTCIAAAVGGHLEVLKWAWEHGCPCWGRGELQARGHRLPAHITAYLSINYDFPNQIITLRNSAT